MLVEKEQDILQWRHAYLLGELEESGARFYRVHFGQVDQAVLVPENRIDLLDHSTTAESTPQTVRESGTPYRVDEHPRERLWRCGAEALSDSELLALLLQNRRAGRTVLDLAREVFLKIAGLPGLKRLDASLRRRLGPANAASLAAAVELSERLARARLPHYDLLDQPEAVASYLNLRYSPSHQETMGALYLDARNRLITEREIFRGTLTRAAVEPRRILKEALIHSASGFIVYHTHPSGDPAPSIEDLNFTRRLAAAGELLGVKLLDHIILGGGRWVSLGREDVW